MLLHDHFTVTELQGVPLSFLLLLLPFIPCSHKCGPTQHLTFLHTSFPHCFIPPPHTTHRLSTMYVTYGYTEFLVVISIAGFICALGAVFAAIVAGHNRFRLWVSGGWGGGGACPFIVAGHNRFRLWVSRGRGRHPHLSWMAGHNRVIQTLGECYVGVHLDGGRRQS